MGQEERRAFFDPVLGIEAYYLKGIVQRFPTHFHEHYVIGTIESGRRLGLCRDEEFLIQPGDLVLFHPHEPHACRQVGEFPLDWRCMNVPAEVMERTVGELTGTVFLPRFGHNVFYQSELAELVRELYTLLSGGGSELEREETFLLLISQLLEDCGDARLSPPAEGDRPEVRAVCRYLEEHYDEPVSLEQLSRLSGLSRCYLLRSFTRQKGISPYRYLETVRIREAKKLLERGVRPVDAALRTGFSDQSHFSNFFRSLTGLTPRQYQECFPPAAGEGSGKGGIQNGTD